MSDDELHLDPSGEQGHTPDEGHAHGPQTGDGTELDDEHDRQQPKGTEPTGVDDPPLPTERANPEIALVDLVKFRWDFSLGGRAVNKVTLETSSPLAGVISPAGVALVTLAAGVVAAVLIGVGAPGWLALVLALLPGTLAGIVTCVGRLRQDAGSPGTSTVLGRRERRGQAVDSGHGDGSGPGDDEPGTGAGGATH